MIIFDESTGLFGIELEFNWLGNVHRVARNRVVPKILPNQRLLRLGVGQIRRHLEKKVNEQIRGEKTLKQRRQLNFDNFLNLFLVSLISNENAWKSRFLRDSGRSLQV